MSNIKLMFESYNHNGNNLYLADILIQGEVGIGEQVLDLDGVSIYPNPSHGLFTLECQQCKEAQNLSVISSEGVEVFSKNIPESKSSLKESIDLSGLSKGIYFIRLSDNVRSRGGKIVLN
jgi:hypothetical protein